MVPRSDDRPGGGPGRLTPAQARTVEAGRDLFRSLGRLPRRREIAARLGIKPGTVDDHLAAAHAAGVDLGFPRAGRTEPRLTEPALDVEIAGTRRKVLLARLWEERHREEMRLQALRIRAAAARERRQGREAVVRNVPPKPE